MELWIVTPYNMELMNYFEGQKNKATTTAFKAKAKKLVSRPRPNIHI